MSVMIRKQLSYLRAEDLQNAINISPQDNQWLVVRQSVVSSGSEVAMLCGRKRKSKKKIQVSLDNFSSKGNVALSSVLVFDIIPIYYYNTLICLNKHEHF